MSSERRSGLARFADPVAQALRNRVTRSLHRRGSLYGLDVLSRLTSHTRTDPAFCRHDHVRDPGKIRLTWVMLPFVAGGGGERTALRVIRHLSERGYAQRILIFDVLEPTTVESVRDVQAAAFFDAGAVLEMFRWDDDLETDVVIATSWYTAYAAAWLQNTAAKLYFVQDLETQHYPVGSEYFLCQNTYCFGFPMVTAGRWLAGTLRQQYGARADSFPLAYDPQEYRVLGEPRLPQVACYVRPNTARRGFNLAVLALRRFQAVRPEWPIALFGAADLPTIPDLRYADLGILDAGDLNRLYNRSSIGFVISGTNYSLIPLEMMAAGLPVLDVDAENNRGIYGDMPDFVTLAEPSPGGLADGLLRLADPARAAAQADAGLRYAHGLTWDESCRQAEQVIRSFLPLDG